MRPRSVDPDVMVRLILGMFRSTFLLLFVITLHRGIHSHIDLIIYGMASVAS